MLRPFAVFLTLVMLLAAGARTGAQEDLATPQPEAAAATADAGMSQDVLLRATIARSSPEPVALRLLRIVLEPDASSPLHAHPGLELGVVEAGTLAVRVEGRAVLLRAEAAGTEAGEPVPAGVEVSLGPGDRIAYAPGTLMTFRNPGPEPATLLAATILPAGPDAPPGAVYPGGLPTAAAVAGIQSRILGDVEAELPLGESAVLLERLHLTSGDAVPGFAGPVLAVIEEGALTGSVLRGEFELPAATAVDQPGEGEKLTLAAGQSIFFQSGMAETPPLAGEGSVTLLRLGIVPLTAAPTASPIAPEATTGPDAIPVDSRVVVVVPEARLRAEPTLDGLLVAGLPQGTILIVIGPPVSGAEYVWYPVQAVVDPALTGFIAAELIAPEP